MYLADDTIHDLAAAIRAALPRATLVCDLMSAAFIARFGGGLLQALRNRGASFAERTVHPSEAIERAGYQRDTASLDRRPRERGRDDPHSPLGSEYVSARAAGRLRYLGFREPASVRPPPRPVSECRPWARPMTRSRPSIRPSSSSSRCSSWPARRCRVPGMSTSLPRASTRSACSIRVPVMYLDLTGSGNETSAHLLENGRLTVMFCAFQGNPKILRLYCHGRVLTRSSRGMDRGRLALRTAAWNPADCRRRRVVGADVVRLRCAADDAGRTARSAAALGRKQGRSGIG